MTGRIRRFETLEPSETALNLIAADPTGRLFELLPVDTKLGVLMELEVDHGATEIYAGVQA